MAEQRRKFDRDMSGLLAQVAGITRVVGTRSNIRSSIEGGLEAASVVDAGVLENGGRA